jgi:hypothetical protein
MTEDEWMQIYQELIVPITQNGANKHGADTWRDPDNVSLQPRNNYRSISAHCLDAYAGITEDHESGLDPRGHAMWRLSAAYIRDRGGLR